jgi:hypothetical protein
VGGWWAAARLGKLLSVILFASALFPRCACPALPCHFSTAIIRSSLLPPDHAPSPTPPALPCPALPCPALQLTINLVALIVAFVAAITNGETPLNVLQLLWVNLIMDSLAALGECRGEGRQAGREGGPPHGEGLANTGGRGGRSRSGAPVWPP